MITPFVPKENQGLPDHYGMKILYVNGQKEEFELASHALRRETQTLEFVTEDDLFNWVPLTSIQRLEFDKRMSKIIALKEQKKEA